MNNRVKVVFFKELKRNYKRQEIYSLNGYKHHNILFYRIGIRLFYWSSKQINSWNYYNYVSYIEYVDIEFSFYSREILECQNY